MEEKRRGRGFAALDEATRRRIASIGGHTAHAKGVAHQYTTEEARLAGRKGGQAVSRDRAYMAAIGRKGGLVRRPRRKQPNNP
jgi:general stress protein YciG